jgi:serine carboxypeptidase-like clade 1
MNCIVYTGPLRMDENYSENLPKLKLNPYGWTHMLNMIYIDMPVGTGFSYSETQEGYYSNDTIWVEHTYSFLQKVNHFSTSIIIYDSSMQKYIMSGNIIFYLLFMQWFIDHPKFSSNPFYIGGGSYSGITTAPLVQKLYEGIY